MASEAVTANLDYFFFVSLRTVILVQMAPLTSEVAGDARHVATHQPHCERKTVVLEDVCHQVHMVGAFASFVCCCVETSCRRERKEYHLQKIVKLGIRLLSWAALAAPLNVLDLMDTTSKMGSPRSCSLGTAHTCRR